jgi:hypothetical protein
MSLGLQLEAMLLVFGKDTDDDLAVLIRLDRAPAQGKGFDLEIRRKRAGATEDDSLAPSSVRFARSRIARRSR